MKISKLLLAPLFSTLLLGDAHFIGVVKPQHNINLSLATDGTVKKVLVKEGSVVKAGEPLVVLENSLQSLETQRRKLIWEDKSKLNSNISAQKILSSLYYATKKLYESSGGVSKSELQSLKIKYLTALGETKYLQENEKKEKIEYEIAKSLLEQYTLRSPISGVVTRVDIDLGEFVKNTEPILSIVDSRSCYVELNLDREAIKKIRKNQLLKVKAEDKSSSIEKEAKVLFISPIADRSSGLFFVKAEFKNENLELLPGLAVEVTLKNIKE